MIYLLLIDTEEDKRKFVLLYEKYRYFMFTIAVRIVKNYHDAEDIVHEAFIKIAKSMHHIHDIDSYETKRFLIIVTRSVAFDYYRKRTRNIENLSYIDEMANDTTAVTYIDSELNGAVQIMEIMMKLSPKYRDVLLLKYSYQYDVKKIADILNITEGNVRQRLLRGRQMLEKALNKLEDK